MWLTTDSKDDASRELVVAPATVGTHISRIRKKYEAVGRPARTKLRLMVRAVQDGVIAIDEL